MAGLETRAKQAVERLEGTLMAGDIARARQEIRDHVGIVTVQADNRAIRLYRGQGHIAAAMLRAAGTPARLRQARAAAARMPPRVGLYH